MSCLKALIGALLVFVVGFSPLMARQSALIYGSGLDAPVTVSSGWGWTDVTNLSPTQLRSLVSLSSPGQTFWRVSLSYKGSGLPSVWTLRLRLSIPGYSSFTIDATTPEPGTSPAALSTVWFPLIDKATKQDVLLTHTTALSVRLITPTGTQANTKIYNVSIQARREAQALTPMLRGAGDKTTVQYGELVRVQTKPYAPQGAGSQASALRFAMEHLYNVFTNSKKASAETAQYVYSLSSGTPLPKESVTIKSASSDPYALSTYLTNYTYHIYSYGDYSKRYIDRFASAWTWHQDNNTYLFVGDLVRPAASNLYNDQSQLVFMVHYDKSSKQWTVIAQGEF